MGRYRCIGLDIVEDSNSIQLKNVTDGNVIFFTDNGNTCYNYDVKFLNRFDKIYHKDPRNDFIEMVAYSLITHGVK